MANYATLKAAIAAAIKENGNKEITGNLLQQQLLAMVNSLGVGYQYAGIATPATDPGTPDQNVFYIASIAGTYTNLGGLVLADGEIAILKYNGAWSKDSTGAASVEMVNQLGQEVEEQIIKLLYIGSSTEIISELPAGSYFYNTYTEKVCKTTSTPGQWIEKQPLEDAIYIYNGYIYLFNGTTIKLVNSIILPNINRCGFYINTSGNLAQYSPNGLSEILNIPRENCTIRGVWNGATLGYSVNFIDENLNFISGFNGSGSTIKWDVEQVVVPASAKYIVLQWQSGNIYIETNENLCTGLDYLREKGIQGINKTQNERLDDIELLLTGQEIEYDASAFLSSGGGITSYADAKATTKYYPLADYITYLVSGVSLWDAQLFVYYDENKNKISSYQSNTAIRDVDIDNLLQRPSNAVYIRFSSCPLSADFGAKIQPRKIYEKQQWANKKWVVIGDSLTEKNVRAKLNYHDYISEETGISIVNLGVSGTGYAKGQNTNDAFYQRVTSIPTDTSIVTLFGSFNDLGSGLQLGEIDDVVTTTICGCINKTLDDIQKRIPLVNIGVATPTPWAFVPPTVGGNSDGEKYVNAIINICKLKSIPCLDLYHCSNLHPWDAYFKAIAYKRDGTYTESTEGTPNAIQVTESLLSYVKANGVPNAAVGDWVIGNLEGVHPDEDGHRMIAPKFKQFISALIY